MTDYRIDVGGPIGPVVRSCLPGFTAFAVPPGTVLAGQVADPDELLSVLNLLDTHGVVTLDIRAISTTTPGKAD